VTAPDHARLRDELTAIDRRMNAHLSCLLCGEPVPVVAVLEDGLRLFGLTAELLNENDELRRRVGDLERNVARGEHSAPSPSHNAGAVPSHSGPPESQ
jgi:hypothetical protein